MSHFWEVPWFFGYETNQAQFTTNVITPLENGNGGNMPSPFAAGGQTARIAALADGEPGADGSPGYKPEIFIFTKSDESGAITYQKPVSHHSEFFGALQKL